ncbi:MAG TPA: LamG domain-containing protein [Pirellulales bacterium]|nr:LamG domain-containing protein [Pirellulales bacterium]
MSNPALLCTALVLLLSSFASAEVLLKERFDTELSKDWFWGLGTWTATDGVLRGYESGPRRHGPVKMRKLLLADGIVECEFRLEGRATFAGIIFNGSQERGHIVHLVMGRDTLRILAHPKPGENVELLKQPNPLAVGQWHRVKIEFHGPQIIATVDGQTFSATHDCIREPKLSFGLGGDSGGPAGEQAGALEFRKLEISTLP